MNIILIDTNFYADIMFGKKEAMDIIHHSEKILISPIVLGELLYGFKNGTHEKDNIHQLEMFLQASSVQEIFLTKKTAQYFAAISAQLKKQGTPIPTNDIWIAACAMEHAAALVTRDQHFDNIHNLILFK